MSFCITFADGGAPVWFDTPVSVREVAAAARPSPDPAWLAGRLDGELVAAATLIDAQACLEFVTERSPLAPGLLRLAMRFVLAEAVQRLHPGTRLGPGGGEGEGFRQDFETRRPLAGADLGAVEAVMRRRLAQPLPASRRVARAEAQALLAGRGEHDQCKRLAQMPAHAPLWLHARGGVILLSGEPLPRLAAGHVFFKLLHVSGAYRDGDSAQPMLTRIHGGAWFSAQARRQGLSRLAQAASRDHRRLAAAMELFHFDPLAPGRVFWRPAGWSLWTEIEGYMRRQLRSGGYQEVRGPQLMDARLWQRSGHAEHYREQMFFTESDTRRYAIKPMSCPGHVEIFKAGARSYRDLPLRYAEFGLCHRNEPSGALHGLMRVREFTQDDGHIFCTAAQIEEEVAAFHRQAIQVYRDFGFEDVVLRLALRPARRMGTEADWDRAESALRGALRGAGMGWEDLPGEGAFYGPKLEYHMADSMGRRWQTGTLQVDFMMPARLGATYVDAHGQRCHPVMLHRAILGSMERFVGILLEHCGGRLPVWLAPLQAVVMSVSQAQADYAAEVAQALCRHGLRCRADVRNETLGQKIRGHSLRKVPYLLVVGEREMRSASVMVRARPGEASRVERWADCAARIASAIARRA